MIIRKMTHLKFTTNTTESLILLLYGIHSFFSLIDESCFEIHTFIRIVRGFVLASCFMLVAILFIRRGEHRARNWIIGICTLLFFAIAGFSTNRSFLFVYALFVLLGQFCLFRNIVVTSMISSGSSILIIVLSSLVGIIPNFRYMSESKTCYCLGFDYYSTVPFVFFYLLVMYIYLRASKIKIWEYVALLIVNSVIFETCYIRLVYYLVMIVIILHFFVRRMSRIKVSSKFFVDYFSAIAFPSAFIVSLFATIGYRPYNVVWRTINKILSGRLYFMNLAFTRYPPKLLGQLIEMEGNSATRTVVNYFYIDSGFVYSLLGYGIVFTMILILFYSAILKYSCIKDNVELFVWCIGVLLFSLINNTWVSLNYNPLLMISVLAIKAVKTSFSSSKSGGMSIV